ncbi:MAG: excisionase family DNA-binding protein [Chloroflexota bacterium]|nr:excisionase family DNA-binding protein [Chloroflexota bacterium]
MRRFVQLLNQNNEGDFKLTRASGEAVEFPPTVLRILHQVARLLAGDKALVLRAIGSELTIYQSAELLNVPIPYLVRLLDEGTLPYRQEGESRLVPHNELLAYRLQDKAQRREALRELTRLSQELRLYDLDLSTIKLKRLAEFDEEVEP